jgi:hypothetical protein
MTRHVNKRPRVRHFHPVLAMTSILSTIRKLKYSKQLQRIPRQVPQKKERIQLGLPREVPCWALSDKLLSDIAEDLYIAAISTELRHQTGSDKASSQSIRHEVHQ